MPADSTEYVSFCDLAMYWASDTGARSDVILFQLCQWALTEAISPGSITDSAGNPLNHFDVLLPLLPYVEINGRRHGQYLPGDIPVPIPRGSLNTLREARVSVEEALAFCERVNAIPPSRLMEGRSNVHSRRNLYPKDCPQGLMRAYDRLRADYADRLINDWRRDFRSYKDTVRGQKAAISTTVLLELWKLEWNTLCEQVNYLDIGSERSNHKSEIARLEVEFKAFILNETDRFQLSDTKTASAAEGSPVVNGLRSSRDHNSGNYRLIIDKRRSKIYFDNISSTLSPRSFSVLSILAESACRGDPFVARDKISDMLLSKNAATSTVSKNISAIRKQFIDSSVPEPAVKDLFEVVRNKGYRLCLGPSEIQIIDLPR